MSQLSRAITLPLLLILAACGGGNQAAATGSSPTQQAAKPAAAGVGEAKAAELFQSLCSTCHGSSGLGDGPGAAAINPKPRSFADAAWQASVSDEHIGKVIVFGGAAVGKSPFMPAQPDLKSQPEVLAALTKIVRGFHRK
jgi:cytochrome c5